MKHENERFLDQMNFSVQLLMTDEVTAAPAIIIIFIGFIRNIVCFRASFRDEENDFSETSFSLFTLFSFSPVNFDCACAFHVLTFKLVPSARQIRTTSRHSQLCNWIFMTHLANCCEMRKNVIGRTLIHISSFDGNAADDALTHKQNRTR